MSERYKCQDIRATVVGRALTARRLLKHIRLVIAINCQLTVLEHLLVFFLLRFPVAGIIVTVPRSDTATTNAGKRKYSHSLLPTPAFWLGLSIKHGSILWVTGFLWNASERVYTRRKWC